MRVIRTHQFGPIESLELGWTLVGQPMLTSHAFLIDGVLIDTGPRRMQRHMLEWAKKKHITQIVLTHHHEDHSGNAAALHAMLGVPVYGDPKTVRLMQTGFSMLPYRHYSSQRPGLLNMLPLEDCVCGEQYSLEPIHTAGHCRDHTVYFLSELKTLFSGDLYVGDRIRYFHSEERMDEEIAALKNLITLDVERLLCAHHPIERRGKEKLQSKLAYLEHFRDQVMELQKKGMDESSVVRALDIGETWRIRLATCGDVSLRNMVRSAASSCELGAPE